MMPHRFLAPYRWIAGTLLASALGCAAAEVSGVLSEDAAWNTAGGPYRIIGDVVVPTNITLRIEAGALVLVTNGASMTALAGGRIEVLGTPAHPVVFDRIDTTNLWKRLAADGTNAMLILRHAEVIGGQVAVTAAAAALIEDCSLHDYRILVAPDFYNAPILITENAASVTVRRCHFREYHEVLCRFGITLVEDCLFEDIHGDGIDFDAARPGSIIRRSTFRHGTATNIDAIDIGSSSTGVVIEECLMFDFPFDKGVSIGERSLDITVRNCVIYDVDAGVAVKDSSVATLYNNTIVDSNFGLNLYEKIPGQGGGHATAFNHILWNNGSAVRLADASTLTLSHSLLSGGQVYPGTNNVNLDPLFLDFARRDLRLAPDSPARGIGLSGEDLGAIEAPGTALLDSDDDQMPDPWEWRFGLHFLDPNDAGEDLDDDRSTNRDEYLAGTHPADPRSVLRFESVEHQAGQLSLRFHAVAARGYRIESRALTDGALWNKLEDRGPALSDGAVTMVDPLADEGTARLYRLLVYP